MNDKLILLLSPYDYKTTNQFGNYFTIQSSVQQQPNKPPIEKVNGFCNTDNLNVDINGYGLKISINPNKMNGYKYNPCNLTFEEFTNAINITQENLNQIGIDSNIKKLAKIFRYDNSFDILTTQEYSKYKALVGFLATATKPLRRGKNRMVSNTLYVGNKSNEIAIYDKKEHQKLDIDILRIEKRRLKIKSKERPLLSSVTEKQFNIIRVTDKEFIEQSIFNKNPYLLQEERDQHLINLLLSDLSFKEIQKELFMKLATEINDNNNNLINEILRVSRTSENYQRNNRIKNMLNKALTTSNIKIIEMYQELKTKFQKAM